MTFENSNKGVPSAKGKEKYPNSQGYVEDPTEFGYFYPCICNNSCKQICDGKRCKCKACKMDYEYFFSCDFTLGDY